MSDDGAAQYAQGMPCWIELGTSDPAAAATFYTALLGWRADEPEPNGSEHRILRKEGKAVASLKPATDPIPGSAWTVYFVSADLDNSIALAAKHGGTVINEPHPVGERGRLAVLTDPAGGSFALWEAGTMAGAELADAPGALHWVELFSTDRDAVTGFYANVLGATTRDIGLSGWLAYRLFQVHGRAVAGALQIIPEMGPMRSTWSIFLRVEDVDAVADAAVTQGARQLMRDDVPAGRMAMLLDPYGAFFSVICPDPDFTP